MKRVLGIGVLVLSVGAASCSRTNAAAATPPRGDVPSVAAAKVTRGDLAQVLTIAAEFRPYQEIDVHAKVAGYVQTIRVDVGDHVKEGELLAVLEVPELQDEVAQDKASIEHASEEVVRAQADLERAQAAHEASHLSSERLAQASKQQPKLIAQQDIDDATSRDRQAEAQVATAKAAIAAAQGQLAYAKANADKTQTLIRYTRITAPFAGVITHRYADKGAMIQAGTSSQSQAMPVVRLSQVNELRLSIAVPESAVPKIQVKTPVSVRVPALGRTFPGTVSRFADRLDQETRTMLVEVDVENPTGQLVPGMYADASLSLKEVKGALLVPIEAIGNREGAEARVFVIGQGNEVEPQQVQVELETADRAAVSGALTPGALVVVGNRDQLKPGTIVTPKVVATAAEGAK
jgi:RND family efflux transporter MFP subunit